MNQEVGHIVRGFLLMLVVLAGFWVVHLLASIKPPQPTAASQRVYLTNNNDSRQPRYYNARGKALFDLHCSACHKLDAEDGDLLRLPYTEERVPNKTLLRGWIRNSDSVLKAGNRYFNALYERWNRTPMPAFPQLHDADIDEILEYLWWRQRH